MDPEPEAGPDPIVVDPPDPVDVVSDTDEPEEKGGSERSDGDGDGGLVLSVPPPLFLSPWTTGDSKTRCCWCCCCP